MIGVTGLGGNAARAARLPRTDAAVRGIEAAVAVLLPRQRDKVPRRFYLLVHLVSNLELTSSGV
jgi:hypothetical protein